MISVPRVPLRVERALPLLGALESVAPLRTLLIALSRRDRRGVWASAGPYLTVGKHLVQPHELRDRVEHLLEQVRGHLAALYEDVVAAMEAEQSGDHAAGASALLRAAEREESLGRLRDARHWCEAALPASSWIRDHHLEIEILLKLGGLCLKLGELGQAARNYQRAFALAEAGVDPTMAIPAAEGMGRVALAEEDWSGAHAWFSQALRLAHLGGDPLTIAEVEHQLATTALERGDLTAAGDLIARARERLEPQAATMAIARLTDTEGRLAARLGARSRAFAAYREALAWIRRAGGDADVEIMVRLNLAALHMHDERYLEAEEEARRSERLAITHGLTSRLVEAYLSLGRLRGHQRDEMGFVFFEQALDLCRGIDRSPALDGLVYGEYATFRDRLGQLAEARELLQCARERFAQLGEVPQLERARSDLKRFSA